MTTGAGTGSANVAEQKALNLEPLKLTDDQRIAGYMLLCIEAGWRSMEEAITIIAIMGGESGYNPTAVNRNTNGSSDYGLLQINSVHRPPEEVKTNPEANIKFGYKVYSEAGRKFRPWVAYNNGSYRRHLPTAQKAASAVQKALIGSGGPGMGVMTFSGGDAWDRLKVAVGLSAAIPALRFRQAVSTATSGAVDVAQTAAQAAGAVQNIATSTGEAFSGLASLPDTIVKTSNFLLVGMVATVALIIGVVLLFLGPKSNRARVGRVVSDTRAEMAKKTALAAATRKPIVPEVSP